MAMFTTTKAQIYAVREHVTSNGKSLWFASFGILSGRKTGEDDQGRAVYKNDKPLYKSARITGKKAIEFLKACDERSFAEILVKQYTYTKGEGDDRKYVEAMEILTASEYIPKAGEEMYEVDSAIVEMTMASAQNSADDLPDEEAA